MLLPRCYIISIISMVYCKTAVSLVRLQWIYCSLALSHHFVVTMHSIAYLVCEGNISYSYISPSPNLLPSQTLHQYSYSCDCDIFFYFSTKHYNKMTVRRPQMCHNAAESYVIFKIIVHHSTFGTFYLYFQRIKSKYLKSCYPTTPYRRRQCTKMSDNSH